MLAASWLGAPDPEAVRPPEVSKAFDLAVLGCSLAAYALSWLFGFAQGGPEWPLLRVASVALLPFWLALRARWTARHRELLAIHIIGATRWTVAYGLLVLAGAVARGSVLRTSVGLLGLFCVYRAAYTFLVGADLRAAVLLLTVQ